MTTNEGGELGGLSPQCLTQETLAANLRLVNERIGLDDLAVTNVNLLTRPSAQWPRKSPADQAKPN